MSQSKTGYYYLKDKAYIVNKQDPSMCLGQGGFGKVYKGYDNINKRWVAIKQINLQLLEEYGDQMKQIILNEINVMIKFSKKIKQNPCQNLVILYDCFKSDKCIYLVMEICNQGTLLSLLKMKKFFTEIEVIEIAKQMTNGILYLEKMNITHRDFKPQNVFITTQEPKQIGGNKRMIFKIGDFGFSAQRTILDDVMGTYPYMAPQIFKRQEYNCKVDVWSLGVTLHQLLFNQLYFIGQDKWTIQKQVIQKQYILTSQKQNKISQNLYNFIRLCLNKNKYQRPYISDLIKSQIFQNINQKVNKQELNQLLNGSVLKMLNFQIQRCRKMNQIAKDFQKLQQRSGNKFNSIFIQLYLQKISLNILNRIVYQIQNKQNIINLPHQKFQQLLNLNSANYQQLNKLSYKNWIQANNKFNLKYQQFQKYYLPHFDQNTKSKINKTINNIPYQQPIMQIFQNELKKWIQNLKNILIISYDQNVFKLLQKCQQIYSQIQQLQ